MPKQSSERHLVSFDPKCYQARGFGGYPSFTQHLEVQRLLTAHLGTNYAEVFASPVLDEAGQVSAWDTRICGEIAPMSHSKKEAGAHLRRLVFEIFELKELLRSSEKAEDRKAAELISDALHIPDSSYVFAVGKTGCIAGWSFSSSKSDQLQEFLEGFGSHTPAPNVTPAQNTTPAPSAASYTRHKKATLVAIAGVSGAAYFFLLPWMTSNAQWHNAEDCWGYRGVIGAAGQRSALALDLCASSNSGGTLEIQLSGHDNCVLSLSKLQEKSGVVFRPVDLAECDADSTPETLDLRCNEAVNGSLSCSINWGGKLYPGRSFNATS